jgi:hypothetical protein
MLGYNTKVLKRLQVGHKQLMSRKGVYVDYLVSMNCEVT